MKSMKITVSVIKADVGGVGGHTKPSDQILLDDFTSVRLLVNRSIIAISDTLMSDKDASGPLLSCK